MPRDDNPQPAFPANQNELNSFDIGLTKREYFAIHCDQPGMAEICWEANLRYERGEVRTFDGRELVAPNFDLWWLTIPQQRRFELYAAVRVSMADALIKELAK